MRQTACGGRRSVGHSMAVLARVLRDRDAHAHIQTTLDPRAGDRADRRLARGARPVAQPNADDLEEQELLLLNRTEIEAALSAGEFKVLAWATVVALAFLTMNHDE